MSIANYVQQHEVEATNLLYDVIDTAQYLYEKAGFKDDFCVQHITNSVIIFGGWNRVIWSPLNGYRVDSSSCREEFIEKFNNVRDNLKVGG